MSKYIGKSIRSQYLMINFIVKIIRCHSYWSKLVGSSVQGVRCPGYQQQKEIINLVKVSLTLDTLDTEAYCWLLVDLIEKVDVISHRQI